MMNKLAWKWLVLIGSAIVCRQAIPQEEGKPCEPDCRNQAPSEEPLAAPPAFFRHAPGQGQHVFQPADIDPDKIRASMKARAEYDALNRNIIARQQELYSGNETINKLQADMRDLQERIDAIMSEDKELLDLRKQLEAIAPQMPFGIERKEPDPVRFRPPREQDGD